MPSGNEMLKGINESESIELPGYMGYYVENIEMDIFLVFLKLLRNFLKS